MNPQLRKALTVASLGAAGGVTFVFACFVLGVGRPDPNGNRGSIGNFVAWLYTPCAWLGDWAIKHQLFASDNVLIGLVVMFAYSAFVGATVAFVAYQLRRLIGSVVPHKR